MNGVPEEGPLTESKPPYSVADLKEKEALFLEKLQEATFKSLTPFHSLKELSEKGIKVFTHTG